MPEVNVEIGGKKYRMACEDGQEAHLMGLARRFDDYVTSFKGDFGEIGDTRLTVMAGIAVLDTLAETERQLAETRTALDEAMRAGETLARDQAALERRLANQMSEVARKVEDAAGAIEQANRSVENA